MRAESSILPGSVNDSGLESPSGMPGTKAEGKERRSLRDSVGTGGFMGLAWLASAWLILAAVTGFIYLKYN